MVGGHTHGGNTNKRRADTSVETSPQAILGDTFLDHIDGAGVDALLGCLEADLGKIEGVADDDGADTTETTSNKRP